MKLHVSRRGVSGSSSSSGSTSNPFHHAKDLALATTGSSSPIQSQLDRLAANTLVEFKVGFNTGELVSKREVRHLIRIIQNDYLKKLHMDKFSMLTSIRIGWHLPSCVLGPMLNEAIPLLFQPPAKITNLQLSFDCWVPEPCLRKIVCWHTLETLELAGIRIRKRHTSDTRHNRGGKGGMKSNVVGGGSVRGSNNAAAGGGGKGKSRKTSIAPMIGSMIHHPLMIHHGNPAERFAPSSEQPSSDSSSLDDSVVGLIPYVSESVETLRLVENNLQNYHIPMLCEHLQRKKNVKALSLRHNRDLDGYALPELFLIGHIKSLDLSICELDDTDGFIIAEALKQQNSGSSQLQKLNVAGNYRMSTAIPALIQQAATSLKAIDCSYCEVQNRCQTQVFKILASTARADCTLRSLKLQGTRMKNADALVECIMANNGIESLIFDHPREPFAIGATNARKIMAALQSNCYVHTIKFDLERFNRDILQEDDAQFWLKLNKCGRSLLYENCASNNNLCWSKVLSNAAQMNDQEIVFWLLRHGSCQF